MILREALRKAAERLERQRIANPRLSAEVILAHCLSVDKTYLYTHDDVSIGDAASQCIENALNARISGVPVQYIVGRQEFYGRDFAVNSDVLIPRPETEYIIEGVLALNPQRRAAIIDVGTGSGCIGVTLALELPETHVTLADISYRALLTARANAAHLGADVTLVAMDLLDAVRGPFDIVVSNPPYVSPQETARLQIEVREHEPHIALFAQEDGLAIYRKLIPAVERVLKPGGYLIMEIGAGLEDRVRSLLETRWHVQATRRDLQDIPRTVVAQLSA